MGAKKRQYYTAQYNTPEAERARKLARVEKTMLEKRRARALKEQAHLSIGDIKLSGAEQPEITRSAPREPADSRGAKSGGEKRAKTPKSSEGAHADAAAATAEREARRRQRAVLTQLHRRHTKKGQLKLGEIGEALFLKLQNGE